MDQTRIRLGIVPLSWVGLGLWLAAWGAAPAAAPKPPRASVELRLWDAMQFGGQVRVDEDKAQELSGDVLSLVGDLGMDTWVGAEVGAQVRVTPKSQVRLSYTRFIFRGRTLIPRDLYFNGAHLEAGSWVDIGATDYYRLLLLWERTVWEKETGRINLLAGVVYDPLSFRTNGHVAPDSSRSETQENFSQQQIPLPVLGLYLEEKINDRTDWSFEFLGTHLPPVETWMEEGGNINLTQSEVEAAFGLHRRIGKNQLSFEYRGRYFHLREQSHEDMNEIEMYGAGPLVEYERRF